MSARFTTGGSTVQRKGCTVRSEGIHGSSPGVHRSPQGVHVARISRVESTSTSCPRSGGVHSGKWWGSFRRVARSFSMGAPPIRVPAPRFLWAARPIPTARPPRSEGCRRHAHRCQGWARRCPPYCGRWPACSRWWPAWFRRLRAAVRPLPSSFRSLPGLRKSLPSGSPRVPRVAPDRSACQPRAAASGTGRHGARGVRDWLCLTYAQVEPDEHHLPLVSPGVNISSTLPGMPP